MFTLKNRGSQAATFSLALLAMSGSAAAQSSDALINKLIEKGILTTQEAKALKAEADKNFTAAYQTKTGLPDWVNQLKFSGDFRGRYDGIYADNAALVDRQRLRYRLRFGVTANLRDDFEVGFRLASGEPVGNFGGNPISGNTTLGDNGSKKFIWLGLAYAKWTPIDTEEWNGAFTFGKMENPLTFPSSVVFGKDYAPEGFAAQLAYKLNAQHSLKLNTTAFVLDELSASSKDPWLGVAQLHLDSSWAKKISSSVGVSVLAISEKNSLVNDGMPNVNRGNTRQANGAPQYNFNPIHTDATLTYAVDKFPGYPGKFPISISGEYLQNPSAPTANEAYSVGFSLGKSGRKHQWSLCYRWQEIQADSWFEELTDVDFAAYYQASQPNSGGTGGCYTGGTNVRGHVLKLDYSPYDSLTFSVTYFLTELIHPNPVSSASGASRVQVDAMWKF